MTRQAARVGRPAPRVAILGAAALAVVGVLVVAVSAGGASSRGAAPSLGASYRPSTSFGTRAACLQKGQLALRSAGFRVERFQHFVRGTGEDVSVLVQCVDAGGSVQLTVVSAGSPGFAAKANDARTCVTAFMLGTRTSCGSARQPPLPAAATGGSGWSATAAGLRGKNGKRFRFTCERGGSKHSVWGTDLYTDDSSVCTAAVHAGLITFAAGGKPTIEIRPGASSYTGSTRNGVSTGSWGAWRGSFVFVR